MTAAAKTATGTPPKRIPVNGAPVRARKLQVIAGAVVLGALGAALIAGGYFNLLQVNWHLFDLKHWWDHLFPYASWALYRHGERNLGEPAAAVMVILSITAPPKTWRYRLSGWQVALRAVVLVVLAVGLIAGAIWLIDFGLPAGWHHLKLPDWSGHFAWAGKASLEVLVAGFLIGRVLHVVWGPAGATVQGHLARRAAARIERRGGRAPLWLRYPLVPVQVRERVSVALLSSEKPAQRGRVSRWAVTAAITLAAVLAAYLIVTGFIAHYWIGAGHSFPFLAPGH